MNGRVVTVALIALVVVVASVVVARTARRRHRDEIRSIHHYHDRLDVLHVEQHDKGGAVRVVDGDPVVATRVAPHRPRLDPDAVHIDGATRDVGSTAPRLRHDREWALDRMEPKARVDTPTFAVALAVVAALVVIAVVGYLIQHDRGRATTRHTATTTRPATTTTVASSITPSSVDGDVATYPLSVRAYTVRVVAAFGAEWVEVTVPPGGPVTYASTLAKGATARVALHGPSMVELGAPNSATVSVDGTPVVFPSPVPPSLSLRFDAA